MTKRSLGLRNIYMRVTIDGRRVMVNIGFINKNGKVTLFDGMPNPGWWGD